jgi:non-specific serine/threonine protein kinase
VAPDASFAVGESQPTIALLCERLDGMPLAIELAAARARVMSPTELLTRIADRFRLLRSRGAANDERHATLQATVEWSYQLLDEAARVVFCRLGIFAAAVDLVAVTAVVGVTPSTSSTSSTP